MARTISDILYDVAFFRAKYKLRLHSLELIIGQIIAY